MLQTLHHGNTADKNLTPSDRRRGRAARVAAKLPRLPTFFPLIRRAAKQHSEERFNGHLFELFVTIS